MNIRLERFNNINEMIIFSITIFIVSQEWKRKGVTIYFYPEVFLEVLLICNFLYINFKISLNKILIFLKNQCNFPKTDEGKLFLPILCECLILIPVESIKLQDVQKGSICLKWDIIAAQPRFTCSKSAIETPEECVESAQN